MDSAPQAGDAFKIAGVDLIYTVTANATVTSGGATLAINPAPASSPADNAVITFLSTSRESANKSRFAKYNFNGTEKIAIVDGLNEPALYDNTTFTVLLDAPTDVIGATFVAEVKNHLFFAKGSTLTFTAPYTDSDFSVANGSGNINVGGTITTLPVSYTHLTLPTIYSV